MVSRVGRASKKKNGHMEDTSSWCGWITLQNGQVFHSYHSSLNTYDDLNQQRGEGGGVDGDDDTAGSEKAWHVQPDRIAKRPKVVVPVLPLQS